MILYFILFLVLVIHFIPVRNKYDVWYIVILIDYLRGIHNPVEQRQKFRLNDFL